VGLPFIIFRYTLGVLRSVVLMPLVSSSFDLFRVVMHMMIRFVMKDLLDPMQHIDEKFFTITPFPYYLSFTLSYCPIRALVSILVALDYCCCCVLLLLLVVACRCFSSCVRVKSGTYLVSDLVIHPPQMHRSSTCELWS